MNEIKKIDINDDRQSCSIPKRTSRSKPFLQKGRQLFLTDSQTDQTKSSSQARAGDIERLEQEVRHLEKENTQLKGQILKLRASQYYGINEEKLRSLIQENQNCRAEIKTLRGELQRTMIQKDFLQRNNRALKEQLSKERFDEGCKENNKLILNSRLKTQQLKIKESDIIDDIDEFLKENRASCKSKRSTSGQRRTMLKKKVFNNIANKEKAQQKWNPQAKKNRDSHHSPLNSDYYLLRSKNNLRKLP